MTYGDITGQSAQNLILGVPRAREGFGAVIVTREMLSSPNSNFNIREPTGQIGTYFGQSVAAVDFNGDGFDELLVGAPLYFESPSIPEIGAVYVYTRDDMFTAPRTTLKGTGNLRQFGYAIAAMGDLNFDTYEDVAISAPYGASGSSQAGGTVIIYFGGSGGIVTTPAQIIVGRELNLLPSLVSGVEAFGVSISGDTDVDGNCYNDLVIGAFESRQVFVLRSRTVAVIETTVTSSVASLRISATGDKPCRLGNQQYDCFNVTYSFSVTGKCFTAGQMFNVSYTLYGDRAAGQSSRVILDENRSTEKRGSVMLTLGTSSQSFNETIYIVNPETIYQIAITPTIVATIPQEPNPSASDGNTTLEDLSTTRIFARQQPSPASVQVLGLRDCADPANCISDLNITAFGIEFNVAAADGLNTLLLGSASTANISMTLDVGPNQDNAYGVCVDISDHPGLQYTSTSQVIGFDRCSAVGGNTQCCIFAPLLKGTQQMVSVSYNILDAGFTNRTAIITLLAKLGAGSVDPNEDNNRRDIEFNVSPSTDVQSRIEFLPSREVTVGERSRSGLPTATEQLGQAFTVRFTYTNSGPGEVTAANLVLSLPYRSACTQQAFLYYISEVRPMQSSLSCRVDPPGAVNALNISASSSSTGASLSDVPGVCDTSVTTIQVTCGPPEVQCVTVTCNVSRFMVRQQLSVEVVGYLDEYFYFNSGNHYTLQVQSDFNIQGDLKDPTPNDIRDTLSITNPNIFTPSEPVPWWAIVVPIVVAILLIIALIVILYLCGFFKRKRSWTPEEDELTNEEGNPQGEGEENENGNENGNENDENRNENENVTSAPDSVIGSTEAVV
jgi:integrin alpha 8